MYMAGQAIKYQDEVKNKRIRIETLEANIKSSIETIEKIKHEHKFIDKYIDYLKWCTSILKRKDKKLAKKQRDAIYNKLKIYKKVLEAVLENNTPLSTENSKQLMVGYGAFLQSGLKFYTSSIDGCKMVLNIDEAYCLAYNKTSNLVSYTFMAMLVRYTLPKNSLLYKQLYHNFLEKAKKVLPHAYANPSHDNVTGLLFLTFISLSHFNITACVRYFGLAVRMAQSLGFDKIVIESNNLLDISKINNLVLTKEKQIWQSISTIYFVLHMFIPNLPSFGIKLIPFDFQLTESSYKSIDNEYTPTSCFCKAPYDLKKFPHGTLNKQTSVMLAKVEIYYHVQSVKLKNENKVGLKSIPFHELRLPSDKLKITASILNYNNLKRTSSSNIQSGLIIDDRFGNLNSHVNNLKANIFKYQWNAFRHSILICLYYPSVLLFPQAVKFPFNEAIILLKASQYLTEFHINLDNIKNNNSELLPDASISCLAHNSGYGRTYFSPYYIQLTYAFYVYLCFVCESEWLLSQGFNDEMVNRCENQALRIIKFLKYVSKSDIKNERKDSLITLEYVETALDNFTIPETLYFKLKSLFH